ncbi:ribonuclease P protein component [Nocardiopsis sp. YSL2]|uniref:ribonuclease P protein component n=1 Tax=Nocardiopsis sp. YSL2 TaxID=2939492 RepID=UPI0026F46D42|nr:ribonuclease P protein component [Nocardiopsis sp. YSL2]
MLSSRNRMRRGSEFSAVMRSGRRASRDAIGLVYLAPPADAVDADPPRVGFVVGKSVGVAVVRKRVQRRLRHVMRSQVDALPDGSLLVVRAKPSAATTRQSELAAQIDSALAAATRPRRGRDGRRGRDARRGRGGRDDHRARGAGASRSETVVDRRPDGDGER